MNFGLYKKTHFQCWWKLKWTHGIFPLLCFAQPSCCYLWETDLWWLCVSPFPLLLRLISLSAGFYNSNTEQCNDLASINDEEMTLLNFLFMKSFKKRPVCGENTEFAVVSIQCKLNFYSIGRLTPVLPDQTPGCQGQPLWKTWEEKQRRDYKLGTEAVFIK